MLLDTDFYRHRESPRATYLQCFRTYEGTGRAGLYGGLDDDKLPFTYFISMANTNKNLFRDPSVSVGD